MLVLALVASLSVAQADVFTSRRNGVGARSDSHFDSRRTVDGRFAGLSPESSALYTGSAVNRAEQETTLPGIKDTEVNIRKINYNYGARQENGRGYRPLSGESYTPRTVATTGSVAGNSPIEYRYGRTSEVTETRTSISALTRINGLASLPSSEAVTADEALNRSQHRIQEDPWDGGPDPAPVGDAVPVMALLAAVVAVIKLYRH